MTTKPAKGHNFVSWFCCRACCLPYCRLIAFICLACCLFYCLFCCLLQYFFPVGHKQDSFIRLRIKRSQICFSNTCGGADQCLLRSFQSAVFQRVQSFYLCSSWLKYHFPVRLVVKAVIPFHIPDNRRSFPFFGILFQNLIIYDDGVVIKQILKSAAKLMKIPAVPPFIKMIVPFYTGCKGAA